MIICLKWYWISLSYEVLSAYSFSPVSLKQSFWGKDHAVCLVYLLVQQVPVQRHLQCSIQLWSVKLKQESPVCFPIPRNTIALWPSPASFNVTFPSQLHFSLLLLGSSPHHLCIPSDTVRSRLLSAGRLMISKQRHSYLLSQDLRLSCFTLPHAPSEQTTSQ